MGEEQLSLTVTGEKDAVAYDSEWSSFVAMLSLRAPSAPADIKRPAIDLVACIDRSGSMNGQKIHLMKQTLELLVTRAGLTSEDKISLVTFDSNVKLELPLTSMDSNGHSIAERVIERVHPGSTTNLSGGALKAIDVLDASARTNAAKTGQEDKQRTRAVMLFTDGLANEGIRDTSSLVAAVSNALASASTKLGGPISMFTFGFGSDHNEECLRKLASCSGTGGQYYYVNGPDDIPNAFADCLGGLTSVVAQNASLSLQPADGVRVSRILGRTYTRDASGEIALGDLFSEDEKNILVELTLPKLTSPAAFAAPVLHASLRAFNVVARAPDVVSVTLTVARPTSTPPEQPVNAALDVQRNRVQTAEAMEEAARMADMGDLAAGRRELQRVRSLVSASSSAAETLSMDLISQCGMLEEQFASTSTYRSIGSKMSKMQAMSNGLERGNHMMSADLYSSGASRKKALKTSWKSTLTNPSGGSDSD